MDANLIAKSLSFHGQPLQKIWEGERGSHDLYRLGITNPDYSVYTMRQKNFTFQDRAKRLKLHQFIAKKATLLFDSNLITDDHGIKSKHKEKFIENTVIMPPFESFINKAIDKNRHIHKIIEIIQPGDIIYGQIIQRSSSGLLIKVLCTGEPLYRYLADLTIKAYVLSQNMIPAHDKRGDQKPYMNNDYVCCEVLEISVDADRINLGMKGTLTIDEKAPLGLITAEQMPEYYKRTIQNQDISYTDLLENSDNFFNPESEDILLEEIGIKSANCIAFSNMNSLKCNFPQQEYANELRQTQASKWAFRSVADGIEHFKVGRHTEAFQCLNKALSIDPRNVEGLVARGALYANSGSFKKAVTDFETALKLNPYHANARKYMGETLVALGRSYEEENRIDDARKAYKDCLIIIPHHEEAKSSLEFLNGKAAANQINKQLIDTNELLPGFKSSMKNSSELITMKDSKRNNSSSSDGFNKKDKLSKKKKKKDKNRNRHHRNHHKRKNVSSSSSDSDNDDDDDTSDHTGSSTTSRSDTDESTDDSSSTTADSRSSSRSPTNASSRQKSKGGHSNKNDDNDNNDIKYNRQKSLSPLSKRMAIMDEQNSLSTTTTARYHFNQPFHLANTTASTSGMSAMAAMGGGIESDDGGGGGGGFDSSIPSSQQMFGPGTSSASRITSADTNLIRHQQDYQHSLTSLSTAATVDAADDYDTKVRNFLEMTRDEEDYESRVRSLVEEVSKYRKERKTSTGIGSGGGGGGGLCGLDRSIGDDGAGGGGISSSGGGGDFDSSGSKKKKDKKKQKKLKKEQKKSKKKKDKEKKSSSTLSHRHHGDRSSSIDIDNMELKEAIEIVKSIPMLDFESKLTADLQKYEKSIDISHRNIPSTSKMTSEYFCQDSESSNSDNNETHQKIGDERKRIRESISTMKKFSNPSRFSRNNLHLNESSFAATIGQKMISSSSSSVATKTPVVLDKFGCFRLAAPDEKVDLPTMMTSNSVSAVSVAAATATTSTIKKRSNSLSPHRHYNSRSRSRSRSRYRRGSSRSPRRSRSARRSKSPQRHSRSRSRRKSRSVRRSSRNSPPSRWSPRRRSPRRRSRSMRRSRTPPHGKSFSRRSVSRTGGGGVGRTSRSRSRSRSVHRRSRSPVNRRSRSIEYSGGRRRRSFSRSVSYNRSRSRSPWRRGRGRSGGGGGGFRGGRGHFSYRGRSRGRSGGFRGGRRSPFFRNRNYSPDRSPPPSSSVHRRDDENSNRSATKSNKGRKDGIDGKWTHDKYEKSGSAESDNDKLQATSNQNEENWDEEDTGTDAAVGGGGAGGSGSVTSTDIAADTADADPNEPTVEEIDKIINKAQKERKEEILQRDKDLLKKPTPTNLPF